MLFNPSRSACGVFSWCKYLSVNLFFFPPLGFWSGNFFLIAPFLDQGLLVPLHACTARFSNHIVGFLIKWLIYYVMIVNSSTGATFCQTHNSNNKYVIKMSRLVGKPTMWFPNRSDTNRPVQLQKQTRRLKFWS